MIGGASVKRCSNMASCVATEERIVSDWRKCVLRMRSSSSLVATEERIVSDWSPVSEIFCRRRFAVATEERIVSDWSREQGAHWSTNSRRRDRGKDRE